MKKIRNLFVIIAMLMLFSAGALFGCADKYKNMEITTDLDNDAVVLYYDKDDEADNTISFDVQVKGVGDGISKSIKQPYGAESVVTATLHEHENSNKTTVTLKAINYGEANMMLTTEEGGKTKTIRVVVEYRLEALEYNADYKPYALVGQTIKINTAKCIKYTPSETTQKDVTYNMIGSYEGVELLPDGTIITSENAQNGTFKVKATSIANNSISTQEFDVKVLSGIESLNVLYGENELEVSNFDDGFNDDALFFSSNMMEESYKILELSTTPNNDAYKFGCRFVDQNGNVTSTLKNGIAQSMTFECYMVDKTHMGVTAINAGDEFLEIVASIEGFEYKSKPFYVKLHSENVAKSVDVTDFDNGSKLDELTIYDDYNGGQGKVIKVEVGGFGAANTNFAIRLNGTNSENADKLRILTGKRDNAGNLIPAKLITTDNADNYDIFPSGTILYLMAVSDKISGDASDIISIDFVATGTMGLLGDEVCKTVTFDLKKGVSEITLKNKTYDGILYVPIKETANGEVLVDSIAIVLQTQANEYTKYIQTNSSNDGYVVVNSVSFEESELTANTREYSFEIFGIKEGTYTLNFFAQNGINIDVRIRVFAKIDNVTITTSSIEQNSDIGQIEYKLTENNLPTLAGGEITLKLGGNANLNINAYFDTYLRRINVLSTTYEFENNNIVRIDNSNRMYGYNAGSTTVTANITTFDDSENGTKTYSLQFVVNVYVALQSATLNAKNVTIYTKSTLGDYVDENGLSDKEKYGEFTFVLKINPEQTIINYEDDISVVWSGSEATTIERHTDYEAVNNTYTIKISMNSLPVTRDIGNARLTITVTQYGRIIVQEAVITIKNATKVSSIYDVKKVQDNVFTNLTTRENSPKLYRDNSSYNYDYYLYFDARDINSDLFNFTFDAKINPLNALNSKLVYIYNPVNQNNDPSRIITINDEVLTLLGDGGIAYIDICAVDSYSRSQNKYLTKVTVLVKVADGLTKSTSLEISSVSDLLKINSVNALDKFYLVTKNINLSSVTNWTPIGYINGSAYQFNGNIDGLISNENGENKYATISGLRLVTKSYDNPIAYYGLFAKLGEDAMVENLNLDVLNVNINDESENIYIGAVAGLNCGEIRNISVNFINGGNNVLTNTNITSTKSVYFGGVVGQNGDGQNVSATLYNVFVTGYVNLDVQEASIGGLVGINYGHIDGQTTFFNMSQFNYSYNSDIYIVSNSSGSVGGIVGTTYGYIENLSFDGIIVANNNVGGIAGKSYADIINTYSSGSVEGEENVGGLVGYANDCSILYSSVNMFDNEKDAVKSNIIGTKNIGGLVGYLDEALISCAYVRSYVTNENHSDLFTEATTYVGGLVGKAINTVNLTKVYARININATNATVGGLVGCSNGTLNVNNSFERNSGATLSGFVAGDGSANVNYFYSTNETSAENLDTSTWNVTSDASSLTDYDWYRPSNSDYPYIIYNQNKILTVEPPTSISVAINPYSSISDYLYEVRDSNNDVLENTYVLYKGKNNLIRFNNLFNVTVLPQDAVLNISSEYSLTSSSSNVIQITGKTSMDYKLKINSTGQVVLTISSKFASDVKTEITIYVLNAVRDFKITEPAGNLLVGSMYELVSSLSGSYVNNNDFYIKFDQSATNYGNLLINGSGNSTLEHRNNEKIFVTATKSGKYSVNYSLFVRLSIDGKNYDVPLINEITSSNQIKNPLEFNFIYGIKDFISDTSVLETGLNDFANIKYTLTGDDLRVITKDEGNNDIYKLPNLSVMFTSGYSKYWNLKIVSANIYFGKTDFETINSINLLKDEYSDDKYDCNFEISDSLRDLLQNDDQKVIKVEYFFEIKPNAIQAETQFKSNSDLSELYANFTAKASIVENIEESADGNAIDRSLSVSSAKFIIKRQKVDNIALKFYTNAEKTKNSNNEDIYTINEVPSDAIIAGQTGMLKISLAPVNAEIKSVKVTYRNDSGYSLSMNQVLKFTEQDGTVKYVNRLPYAVATNNGMGIELYHNESNHMESYNSLTNQIITNTSYDGNLYVNCLLSSSVPSNEIFYITVDVFYIDGNHHISSTIELASRLASTIKIAYDFNKQSLDNVAYIAKNVSTEFYVEFTEIIDQDELLNIESILSPSKIFNGQGNAKIEFAKNADESIKIKSLGNGYKVYYNITSTENASISLQAKITKTKNGIQTLFMSNAIKINFVDFVVTNIKINDDGNETNSLKVSQSSTRKLSVSLSYVCDETIKEVKQIEFADANYTITEYVKVLTDKINEDFNSWFGRKSGENYYTPLSIDVNNQSSYENYHVYKDSDDNKDYIAVGVKVINSNAIIYNEIALNYDSGYPQLDELEYKPKKLFDEGHHLGFVNTTGHYTQYLRDDVTLNLVSDVSSKNPIPIRNSEEFISMANSEDGNLLYYALDNDIILDDYLPLNLQNISFDGNMHTITIRSFRVSQTNGDAITYISNYGLFNEISTNSIVQNLNVFYDGLVKLSENENSDVLNTSEYEINSFNFGGVCTLNNGIIYNVCVKGDKLIFTNNTAHQVYIAGICANNSGYISFATNELSFEANCGYIAGLSAVNSRKISNSKVLINGVISNTFTSVANSVTAGFVSRNTGEIFGCYVSTKTNDIKDATISSRSNVGGFVNQNTGDIRNCYSNVNIDGTNRASGFVFDNSGIIESCYSSSKLLQNSSAHTPFVGSNEYGRMLNTGSMTDCYYIASSTEFISVTDEQALATKVINGKDKSNFAKFVFADKNKINGTWYFDYNNDTISNPKLVDADLTLHSQQKCNGLTMGDDGKSYYKWTFVDSKLDFGKINDNKYNPRTIKNIDEWNTILGKKGDNELNTTDAFVVLKDIVSSRDETPATSKLSFGGILLGNNMKISNLYLRADKDTSTSKSFGLFKEVAGIKNGNQETKSVVKDLTIVAKQVISSNARNVGAFAGYINFADIINITVDCTDVEAVQGRNMVGAFAGIINESRIENINVSGSVHAGYADKTYEFANYSTETNDLDILTNDKNNDDAPYSYAGAFAGALLGKTTAKYINVTGDNKVIGYFAGSVAGLIDEDAKLILASVELTETQYVRAYAIAGGVVGENRGIIDRTYIEHSKTIQDAIDLDLSVTKSYTSGRNLTFFVGSPYFIGGFVGFNNGGTITNSYTKLDVRTNKYVTLAAGGFVGLDVGGNITNCYATGSVVCIYTIGGFIGAVSDEATLLQSTIELDTLGRPEKEATKNNLDASNNNKSIQIFVSNYEYITTNQNGVETWTQTRNAEARSAFISNSKLFMANNIASNKWIMGYTDSMGLTDAEYLRSAVVGLMIGSVVDHQANQTSDLLKSFENDEQKYENAYKYGFKKTTLDDVFSEDMLTTIDDNGTPKTIFRTDLHNYINTQAYQTDNKVQLNQKTISKDGNGAILTGILDNENHENVEYDFDETDGNGVKIGVINAIENSSIGVYKMQFSLSADKYEDKPKNLAKCTVNGTLITFANIVNRDELLLNETQGLYAYFNKIIKRNANGEIVYDTGDNMVYENYTAFVLPEYMPYGTNTTPIYAKIVINLNK